MLENIHPKNYFPDPGVPMHKMQDGEFVSFITSYGYHKLLARQRDGECFNVEYLKDCNGAMQLSEPVPLDNMVHPERLMDLPRSNKIDVLTVYWDVVPSEWGLGRNQYPEKWLFEVAGEKHIIIRAQPANLKHNMYPVTACSPTFDGYSVSPTSLMEIIFELQNTADWLMRSRYRNVQSAINNKAIIDPWLARYDQVIDPDAIAVCIREHVWGRGVENTVKQMDAMDVTQGNIRDVGFIIDIIQRTTGAVDAVQGVIRPVGEAKSATEMRDARMSALSRIQKGTRIISLQSIYDLGFMMAHNTQQFMEDKTFVNIVGDSYKDLIMLYGAGSIPVTQADIKLDFDVIPSDAVTPGGEYLPELVQIFQLAQNNPVTIQAFDPVKQILDMYTRAGVKGAYQFLVTKSADSGAEMTAEAPGAVPLNPAELYTQ